MEKKIGVLHEIGDLGLGFDEVPQDQEQALKEQMKEQQKKTNSLAMRWGSTLHRIYFVF